MSGAPGGLAVDATGTLKWAAPVAGSYTFTVTASTAAGKSASASYSLKVIAATAPTFSGSGKFSGTAGSAFSGTLSASNPNGGTLSYSVAGAPAGLSASTTGALSWASPVAGSYTFTATVTDSYGYSSKQTETLTIAAPAVTTPSSAPTLASAHWTTKAGTAFSTMVTGHAAAGGSLSYTAVGAPAGFNLMVSGFVYYPNAVKGSYAITVTVRDNKGAATSAVMTLVVS